MGDGIISRRGLGNSSDLSNYYNKTETDNLLSGKVDKVAGKQLSTEDFTTAEKTKLANISGGPNYSTGTWTPTFAYYFKLETLPLMSEWRNLSATYIQQHGIYILIGDLCYVNFSVKGTITPPGNYTMGIGGFPFTANSSTSWQTLTLGACVRYDDTASDNDQEWTPPSGIVARLENNSKYAMIGRSNGYINTWWPTDQTTHPYYIEGSGVYKIKNSNLSETLLDTTGSSAPPVGGQS